MRTNTTETAGRAQPQLTGLAYVSDPLAIAESLCEAAALPPGSIILQACYQRLKASVSALVMYRGTIEDQPFHCYAKSFSAAAHDKFTKACLRSVRDCSPLPGRVVLSELRTVILCFPNDLVLRSLRRLATPYSVLSYKPERRAVLHLAQQNHGDIVLKTYRTRAYSAALKRAEMARAVPSMPRLLGGEEKYARLYFRWQAGTPLNEAIVQGSAEEDLVGDAAALLADLHAQALPASLAPLEIDPGSRLSQLRDDLCVYTGKPMPEFAVFERLARAMSPQQDKPVFCHGDFYSNQVLCTDTGLRFLDTDNLCAAPTGFDVGLFIAHLRFDVARGRITAARCDKLTRAFLARYRAQRRMSEQALTHWTVFGLLQLSHRAYRDAMPEPLQRTRHWLQQCLNYLNNLPAREDATVETSI